MKTNFERGQLNAQDDLNLNFKEIEKFMTKEPPFEAYFGTGPDGTDISSGYTYKLGPLVGTDLGHSQSSLPFVISADNTSITFTREVTISIIGTFKFHGSRGGTDYAYAIASIGSKNYYISQIGAPPSLSLDKASTIDGSVNVKVQEGDVFKFKASIRDGKKLFRTALVSLAIKEIKGV